jgi:hypothetical protein
METKDHEYYVSPEVANLLEKAGFDWRCRKCYNKGVLFDMESDEIRAQCPQHSSYDVLAPTLEVAQRWLREVKGIIISPDVRDIDYIKYNATIHAIYKEMNPELHIEGVGTIHFVPYGLICKGITGFYDTYEESLEDGIKIALETILEKGE